MSSPVTAVPKMVDRKMIEPTGPPPLGRASSRPLTLVPRKKSRGPVWRGAGVVLLAVAVVVANWLIVQNQHQAATQPSGGGAAVARISEEGLKTLAGAVPTPLFWAGPRSGFTYELSKNDDDLVWLRYLPAVTPVGADIPHLTIGTYPMADAYAVTSRLAQTPGAVRIPLDDGIAYFDPRSPTSVYVAFRGVDAQIEVYDPSAAAARQLVVSGQVRPVAG